jgi:stage II sporulation protein D
MRALQRFAALALLVAGVGLPLAPAGAVTPARGWVVDAVRFEPVEGERALEAVGTGTYRGALEVRRASGGLAVVNDVSLDDYVRGVSEVPASWPVEALKAQAVAARTYALWQRARGRGGPWRQAGADICATQACQVYRGVAREQQEDGDRWVQAADATRGQVLLWRGLLIPAYYSSSNGGHTVSGGVPWLPAVPDPDDAASPLHHWRHVVPLPDLARVFAVPGNLFNAGRSGDSIVLTSQLEDGTQWQRSIAAADFRAQLNAGYRAPAPLPKAVPSIRYTVETTSEGAVVDGRGWGHGLGLSQYGALGKARRGLRAPEILAAYYGGLRPVVLPRERHPATIRVAVELGQARVTVRGPGRYRVLDGQGRLLSPLGAGAWEVVSDRGGVRVVPPAGADGPLLLSADLDPEGTAVRLRLSAPAIVELRSAGAGPKTLTRPRLVYVGETIVEVPKLSRVVVHADAGAGRTVITEVGAAATAVVSRSATGPIASRATTSRSLAGPGALATALWLSAGAALVAVGWRARRAAAAILPLQ